ncbi:hypothetical protein EV644_11942 [Kribbella orskensis]|uniref:Cobalt/nickel transport protein n=1 Tax=Kribbella orskensis TaxID=2512216 RepID=A0ABY2BBC8_9ACTN|nr:MULTISPECIES: hypothetical protein [Kribbella]TCN34640.1 hypothetical protein EV642_120101 [Kribbella sp. VKM Ac-2500]TCO14929.1 hypothetical protein EV644_11942 [Kribbella orskensis]
MNHRSSVLAAVALAVGVTTLGAVDASAILPEERGGVVPHDSLVSAYYPQAGVTALEGAAVGTSSDDNGVDVLQAGVTALGGAGVAIAGMWLYRRRHAHIA